MYLISEITSYVDFQALQSLKSADGQLALCVRICCVPAHPTLRTCTVLYGDLTTEAHTPATLLGVECPQVLVRGTSGCNGAMRLAALGGCSFNTYIPKYRT